MPLPVKAVADERTRLRHTTAALAISAGATVKGAETAWACNRRDDADRYGHLLNDDLSGVVDALGKAIDNTAVFRTSEEG